MRGKTRCLVGVKTSGINPVRFKAKIRRSKAVKNQPNPGNLKGFKLLLRSPNIDLFIRVVTRASCDLEIHFLGVKTTKGRRIEIQFLIRVDEEGSNVENNPDIIKFY